MLRWGEIVSFVNEIKRKKWQYCQKIVQNKWDKLKQNRGSTSDELHIVYFSCSLVILKSDLIF